MGSAEDDVLENRPPQYVSLVQAAGILLPTDLDRADKIQGIVDYQRHDGLKIWLREGQVFVAMKVSDSKKEEIETRQWDSSKDKIELCTFQFSGGSDLTIYTVRVDGVEYYTCSKSLFSEHSIDPIRCDLSNAYIDRDDLAEFETKLSSQTKPKELPLYADSESEFYAPKLVDAIRAHKELYPAKESDYLPHNTVAGDRIKRWLDTAEPVGEWGSDKQAKEKLTAILRLFKTRKKHSKNKKTGKPTQ